MRQIQKNNNKTQDNTKQARPKERQQDYRETSGNKTNSGNKESSRVREHTNDKQGLPQGCHTSNTQKTPSPGTIRQDKNRPQLAPTGSSTKTTSKTYSKG